MTSPIIKTPKLVLLIMAFLGPIALNVYAPIMPTLKIVFSTSADAVQLGMTIFLLFFAFSQLFCGLFVEIFGQKKVLLVGVILYIFGSAIGIISNNICWLILARVLQAIGGGFSLLLTRSIILEQNSPNKAAANLSYVALGMASVQTVMPTISGYLNVQFSWHIVFYLSLVIAILALWAIYHFLPESPLNNENDTDQCLTISSLNVNQAGKASKSSIKDILNHYIHILVIPRFFYLALTNALISSGFFVFVLNVPFIVVDHLSGDSLDYGKWYLFVALGFWVGSFVSSQISERVGTHKMLTISLYLAPLAGCAMTFIVMIYDLNYWSLFIPMALFSFSRGVLLPNAQASAVSGMSNNRATAMGIFSFCQLIIGASIAQFSVLFIKKNIFYLPIVISLLTIIALFTYSKAVNSQTR
jgi:DHA1 family bicyclomycin/chloramphenicol resistance-like MFS transporter